MLIDTHCHIHETSYPLNVSEVLERARNDEVEKMICVGTSEQSSRDAVVFAAKHTNVYASIGVHPHDTKDGWTDVLGINEHSDEKSIVAIGEIGLDYFYNHSPRDIQIEALQAQIELAVTKNLPIIFHVRDAFDDFWPLLDNFHGVRGVLHSFTDNVTNLEQALGRNLYIGVNGISTFTKDINQQAMFAAIPLDRMLLETDAPFLTPTPFRGKVNEPAFVRNVAKHQAVAHGVSFEEIAVATTANADALFAF